jgi:hypothetical protein
MIEVREKAIRAAAALPAASSEGLRLKAAMLGDAMKLAHGLLLEDHHEERHLAVSVAADAERLLQVEGGAVVMPDMSRRATIALPASLAAFHAIPARAAPQASNLDAELIRVCEAHPGMLDALDKHGSGEDECPYWLAYERSRNAIDASRPATMAGVLAKAAAAKREALDREGNTYTWEGTRGGAWAWDLMNDLLRLMGGA